MIAGQLGLTARQINSFDQFLLDGTEKALNALESMLGLDIDSSDSCIEIVPALGSEYLKHLGRGTLYTVSSAILGEMQGRALLLMRANDFKLLGEVMRPVLSLLFLSNPDADLEELDKGKPVWLAEIDAVQTEDHAFQEQMLDTLAEIGNILIGLYTKAIYRVFDINTYHSVPRTLRDPDQLAIQQILSASEPSSDLHLVIENEFSVMERSIKLWCVISPTKKSFNDILHKIDY